MPEESKVLNAVPAGRALKVVKSVGSAARKHETKAETTEPEKPMVGPGFWILVAVTAFDELVLDLLANLSVVFSILTIFTGLLIAALTFGYLFFSGVPMDMGNVGTQSIALLIEMIPFLSIFPTAVISLFVIRWLAQKEHKEKLVRIRKEANSGPRAAPSPA